MTETPEERARRLGLTAESPEERATRLGISPRESLRASLPALRTVTESTRAVPFALDVEQPKRESLAVDVAPQESTSALPYDPERPGDFEALKSFPAGLKKVAPEAARGAAALTLSAAQGVPGVEAFEAGMGALGSQFTDSPMGFRESRDALRTETSKIPPEIRLASQLAVGGGAGAMAAKAPGRVGTFMKSPARAGMAFGAGDQAFSPSDMSLEQRLLRTGAGGAVGGVVGKTLDALIAGVRGMTTPTTGKNVVNREAAMGDVDDRLFGIADMEGIAAGGTSAQIQAALKHPKIAPHVARVRGTEKFKNASDAEVLTEVYRSLGRQQRALGSKIAASEDHLPDEELMREELGDLKKILAQGADTDMPTFRVANKAHADAEGDLEAVELGATAMSRAGMKTHPSKAGRLSQEAYEREFAKLPPERRPLAAEGALGNLRDYRLGLRPSVPSLGGTLTTADALLRAGPLLRRIGDPTTARLDDLIRSGMLGATTLEELIARQ